MSTGFCVLCTSFWRSFVGDRADVSIRVDHGVGSLDDPTVPGLLPVLVIREIVILDIEGEVVLGIGIAGIFLLLLLLHSLHLLLLDLKDGSWRWGGLDDLLYHGDLDLRVVLWGSVGDRLVGLDCRNGLGVLDWTCDVDWGCRSIRDG